MCDVDAHICVSSLNILIISVLNNDKTQICVYQRVNQLGNYSKMLRTERGALLVHGFETDAVEMSFEAKNARCRI